jgi:hypothetical protein
LTVLKATLRQKGLEMMRQGLVAMIPVDAEQAQGRHRKFPSDPARRERHPLAVTKQPRCQRSVAARELD